MSKSNLKSIFEDYLYASNYLERSAIVNMMMEEIFKSGFDTTSLEFFSRNFDKKLKQQLISEIFKELEHSDEATKIQIIDTLASFIIETTQLIQDQILPIYFDNISNKRDFKLVFTTLKIFTSKWEYFNDDLKKRLYIEFLKVLDNPFDMFIEEGIFEITNILLNSKFSLDLTQNLFSNEEIRNYLKRLIKIALKSKGGPLYAALESIKQVLETNQAFISKDIYDLIFPLFKKVSKSIAIFYPAKRSFIKLSLSFVNLILMFEKDFCEEIYVKNFKTIIIKMSSKIDHADIKYFLEVIVYILNNSNKLPKIEVIKPTFPILRSLYQKKDRLDDYMNGLVDEIIIIIWPLISEDDKDLFFQETEFGNSVV